MIKAFPCYLLWFEKVTKVTPEFWRALSYFFPNGNEFLRSGGGRLVFPCFIVVCLHLIEVYVVKHI